MCMKQRRREKRKGKSEVKRRRRKSRRRWWWWWGDAGFHAGCCPIFQFSSCLLHAFPKNLWFPQHKLYWSFNCVRKQNWRGKRISQPISCVSKHGTGLLFACTCTYLRWFLLNTSQTLNVTETENGKNSNMSSPPGMMLIYMILRKVKRQLLY